IADNEKPCYFMCFNNVGAAGSRGSGSNFMIASIKNKKTLCGLGLLAFLREIPKWCVNGYFNLNTARYSQFFGESGQPFFG
ncbi:MAG: hypothetical protein FWC50_05775, partial [Planctomycetaceae bacterium]|nr:hypothetical protein [Planctomycetaceae bacterium]